MFACNFECAIGKLKRAMPILLNRGRYGAPVQSPRQREGMIAALKNIQDNATVFRCLFKIAQHPKAPGFIGMSDSADVHAISICNRTTFEFVISNNCPVEI